MLCYITWFAVRTNTVYNASTVFLLNQLIHRLNTLTHLFGVRVRVNLALNCDVLVSHLVNIPCGIVDGFPSTLVEYVIRDYLAILVRVLLFAPTDG